MKRGFACALQIGATVMGLLTILCVTAARSQAVERIVRDEEAVRGGTPSYWHTASGYGVDGSMTWTYVNGSKRDNWMEWKSGLGPGTYEVLVFIPRNHATTRNAVYHLLSGGGEIASRSVNQYDIYDKWVSLGSYHFDAEPSVLLGDDTGESYSTKRQIGFDEVKFVGTPDTVPPPQPMERTIQESQAVRGGNPIHWHEVSGYGSDGRMVWTYVNGSARDNWMEWKSGVPGGWYAIQVFIPRMHATTRNAVYHIRDAGNEIATRKLDQYVYNDAWVELGVYEFRGEPSVLLGDDTGESYSTKRKVGFDAVKFVPTAKPPPPPPGFDGFDYPFGNRVNTAGWNKLGNPFENPCPPGRCGGNRGPYHPGEDWNRNDGRDANETVYSVGYGVVKSVKNLGSRGFGVAVRHDTWKGTRYSVYIHVYQVVVKQGQTVTRGQPIAKIYPMAGPHLHLEIRSFMLGDGTGDWYPNDDGTGYYYTLAALERDGFLRPSDEIEAQRPGSR